MTMVSQALNRWPLAALILSAAMLAAAHAFETFGHLAPCALCLEQRDVYWTAMAVAGIGVLLSLTDRGGGAGGAVCALLALIFLYGAGLAVYHAGAEWGWWKGPASCSGGAAHVTVAELTRALSAKGSLPACDKAAWVFLGLSMAGWNALVSLALAIASGLAATRRRTA